MIKKAFLPVAGMGTRTFPASISIPKEMFPLGDKPIIQHLVEEISDAGIKEIVIILNPSKDAIKDHFDHPPKLENFLLTRNKRKELEIIRSLKNLGKIYFTYQNEQLGDGHAILSAENFIENKEDILIFFGDDLIINKDSAAKQLLTAHKAYNCPIVACKKIDKKESEFYGMLEIKNGKKNIYEVISMVEKPKKEKTPSDLAVIGKYIINREIFENLKKTAAISKNEIRLIDGFKKYLQNKNKLIALEIKGKRYDTGKIGGFIQANIAYCLNHPSLRNEILPFLRKELKNK